MVRSIKLKMLKNERRGKCLCGNTATKVKMAAWCCDRCDTLESRMRSELGAIVGRAFRAKYSEMDFRGRVFAR